jgi:hypothetical protein
MMAREGEPSSQTTTVSVTILLIIMITTVTTIAGYSTTLNSPGTAAPSTSCTGLQILSITGISTATSGTITIRGCGFGSDPTLVNNTIAGDGSVDTVQSNVTPSIAFLMGLTPAGNSWTWEAGFANDPLHYDTIGLYIYSWTDNTIVIHGFGSFLGTGGLKKFNLAKGNNVTVVVVGPDCSQSTYNFPPFPASCSAHLSLIVSR